MTNKYLKNRQCSNIIWRIYCLLTVIIFESDYFFRRIFAVSSFFILFGLIIVLEGCSTTYAPVEHRNTTSYDVKKKYAGKIPTYHIVRKGDTLYSIAWRYGQDYKSLAYRNKIKAPYRIYVGNKLRLTTRRTTAKSSQAKTKSDTKYSYKNKTAYKSTKKMPVKSTSNKSTGKKRTTNAKKTIYSGSKRLSWNWPVKGKVIQYYAPKNGKKGIDISAAKGTLVKSSEAGKVVYSGQGLVGYGRLIIIKHNDTFLSAYAHNQNLLVNEGQLVKKGQSIAQLGRSGTDRYKLHFEIRKNGKPVNPMSYLPH